MRNEIKDSRHTVTKLGTTRTREYAKEFLDQSDGSQGQETISRNGQTYCLKTFKMSLSPELSLKKNHQSKVNHVGS